MNENTANTPLAPNPQPIQGEKPLPPERPFLPEKPKRPVTRMEKLLLPVALLVAVLCDRLLLAPVLRDSEAFTSWAGLFWLCYLMLFTAFYWKRLARNRVLWYVAGCSALLCLWSIFFARHNHNEAYRILTWLVIPAVLMAHAQFAAGEYKLKEAGAVAAAWLLGWVMRPFSGIPAFCEAVGSVFSGENRSPARKAILGVAVTLPLFCVIVPLLSGADAVFGYYLRRMMGGWDWGSFVAHTVLIVIAVTLFYSFLWNVGFGAKDRPAPKTAGEIDAIVAGIVLGSVTALYLVFTAVQFTYLFAGAGLPDGMTYSEYAREGFAQTVAVCALNLLIFGVFLEYGAKRRAVSGLLIGLLALTGGMLCSGFLRLWLYIEAYGLTWLRVLSAWFVIYLAVVVVLSAVRMARPKLPAIAVSALVLLGWYVVLGYANPDALIQRYNLLHNFIQ